MSAPIDPRRRPVRRLRVSCALLLVASSWAAADTLEGPATVQADGSGSFDYSVVFTAGPEGSALVYWEAVGGENTNFQDFIVDAFCLFPLEPGEEVAETLSGSLVDLSMPGSVTVTFQNCANESFSLTTTILPASEAVPTVSEWGAALMALLFVTGGTILFGRGTVALLPGAAAGGARVVSRRPAPLFVASTFGRCLSVTMLVTLAALGAAASLGARPDRVDVAGAALCAVAAAYLTHLWCATIDRTR